MINFCKNIVLLFSEIKQKLLLRLSYSENEVFILSVFYLIIKFSNNYLFHLFLINTIDLKKINKQYYQKFKYWSFSWLYSYSRHDMIISVHKRNNCRRDSFFNCREQKLLYGFLVGTRLVLTRFPNDSRSDSNKLKWQKLFNLICSKTHRFFVNCETQIQIYPFSVKLYYLYYYYFFYENLFIT